MAKESKLIPKLIKWPEDWIAAIDKARGAVPFCDFVRDAVRAQLSGKLSEMPAWGQGRPPLKKKRK